MIDASPAARPGIYRRATINRKAAIVGIGQTAFMRDVTQRRSELDLALEAIVAAAADAGVDIGEIDGVVRYSQDAVNEAWLVQNLGLSNLRFHQQIGFGGQSSAAVVGHAAAAVVAGLANTVVCFRSLNGYSATRYGRAERSVDTEAPVARGTAVPSGAFAGPYGLLAPAHAMALWAKRYAFEHRIEEDALIDALGRIAVDQRVFAQSNPQALMREKPLDLTAHRASRVLADPLRLFDLCLESDGAVAVVITDADRARALRDDPVYVLATDQGLFEESMEIYSELGNGPAHRGAATRLFADAGIASSDVDVAMLYDASTLMVLLQLEGYGFVDPGRAVVHVNEYGIGAASPLPVNTSGGHLSEAYVHGMNLLAEAVRQLRGTSVNQVRDAEVALFGAMGASGLVLAR